MDPEFIKHLKGLNIAERLDSARDTSRTLDHRVAELERALSTLQAS